MARKVENIDGDMYAWVSPDGTIQLSLMAPDIPTLLGITKLFSKSGMVKTSKEMLNNGFEIHKVYAKITSLLPVKMDGEIMAAAML